ncbi:hypothetical protein LH464_15125 [Neorhizobium sp. T786]|uniref:hypothetical protein n=1 Tax=Pseudorhizobium xiangyangii TaxID=2883104 RepID=UPI001CFFC2AF|nr:hypothetical protein [Neorhizobium xiangyangii]MCB5203803.1 hypothetical protein [Neorhizobium xiangyangii]
MPDTNKTLCVVVRSDDHGHWVEWSNDGDTGSLGPYQDAEMAKKVRTAKEREFAVNQTRTIQ